MVAPGLSEHWAESASILKCVGFFGACEASRSVSGPSLILVVMTPRTHQRLIELFLMSISMGFPSQICFCFSDFRSMSVFLSILEHDLFQKFCVVFFE